MLQGDFNAYTSTQPDFIVNDNFNNFTNEDDQYIEDQYMPRNNRDSKLPNNSGKFLLNLCKESGLRILNGRKIGDPQGNFTCITYNGCSVVDYIIVSQEFINSIGYFEVHNFTSLSNHCALSCTLFSCFGQCVEQCPLDPLPGKFLWTSEAIEKYSQYINSPQCHRELDQFMNTDFTDSEKAVTAFNTILIENAKKSAKFITKMPVLNCKKLKRKTWTSDNCIDLHTSVKNYAKLVNKFPYKMEYRKKFYSLRSKLRRLCRYEEKQYKKKICTELTNISDKNPKIFWNLLNKLENKSKSERIKLPHSTFINFYKNLNKRDEGNNPFQIKIIEEFENLLQSLNSELASTDFDKEIQQDEIRKAVSSLRNGKSSSLDMISNEMLKNGTSVLIKPLNKLFNLVLSNGLFPKIWNESLLVLIHKKGDKLDPSNYRGISITSNLGKLFNKIIFNRLMKFINTNNLICKNQIGFKERSRTADHIFTLKSIVDNFKTKHKKVFAAFIDLRKAFDTVWRIGLFYKLLKNNIPNYISKILISMYTNTTCRIKFENGLSSTFLSERGVKQGDVMSPLLFNFFIDSLVKHLNCPNMDPVVMDNKSLNIMLYADDIVLVSESQIGLQKCLDELYSFCNNWKLEVNTDKSKVIVFNSNGKTYKNLFTYHNTGIETVTQYNYLGIIMKYNGKFNVAINALIEKARKAYFKIKKNVGINNPCRLLEKLYDSLVSPIMLYCSEIWGIDLIFKEIDPIEKFHIKFIKEILGVHCKAQNDACRAELARLPMKNKIKHSIIGFLVHLLSDENTLVYEIYTSTKNSNPWVKLTKNMLDSLGYSYLINNQFMLKPSLVLIKQRINDQCAQEQNSNIKNSTKLEFFQGVYKMGERPAYVDKLINITDRSMLCKIRTSSHQLMIERGRHLNISKKDRLCPICKSNIEDEYHFLFNCSSYQTQRDSFENKMINHYKLYKKMSNEGKLNIMMNNNCIQILKMSSNFISDCFQLRKSMIQ